MQLNIKATVNNLV